MGLEIKTFEQFMVEVNREKKHYALFRDVELDERQLFQLFIEGKSAIEALNDLSTAT